MQTHWSTILAIILRKKTPFLLVFFVVFTISYATLSWLDFLPEPKSEVAEVAKDQDKDEVKTATSTLELEAVSDQIVDEVNDLPPILPKSITINSLDRSIKVFNPTSHKVEDLDAALLHGVVRHPDSATLNQKGTVFILGHSSYLPAVKNPNFQAFNGIQNLKWGDTITVYATEGEFVYRVDRVYKANAKDHVIPIAGETMKLVIATCNSFGSTDDRYIVEADLVKKTLY